MPLSDDTMGESFRGLILRLRGRTGLTQRELAARVGVNVNSIQGWEAGANYPGLASLKALIAAGLQSGAFTAGREIEEARDLWSANLREATRFRTPFDDAWFQQIAAGRARPALQDVRRESIATTLRNSTGRPGRQSWGDAPDVIDFVGRVSERELIRRWASGERRRLVAVLGLGGIGKTLLATRVARDLAPGCDYVFWRSLRDAPSPGEWLSEAVGFLAPNDSSPPQGEAALLRRLLELLRDARCLLVLDNFETALQPGGNAGDYRPGYERYGTLLRHVAEASHRSCLIITSREEPPELVPLRGEHGPVRVALLAGLRVEDGRALLSSKQLDGDDAAWQALVGHCGGNGLALKVVAETTRELFGGSIPDFLEYATDSAGVVVGGVRQLIRAQVQRLSEPEQEVLRRIAVAREPVGIAELATSLAPGFGRGVTLEAVEGLRRRSLLERTERGPQFGLQSVVLEYVTDQLVEDIAHELMSGDLNHLLRQPLLHATAKEYVRRSQERLIVAPLVQRLVEASGGVQTAEQQLVRLLDKQRGRLMEDQSYAPGNIVNVLRHLRGDLRGADLSGLAIRHVYLQDVDAQGASLAGAHLADTVLGEAFSNPTSLALSGNGAYLAVGTASGDVCRWRVADRTLLATLPGHIGPAWGVTLNGDGRLMVSGGVDGTVRLWDAESGRPLAALHGHAGGVRSVAVSEDGRLVASGGVDGTLRLWDVGAERLRVALHGHTGEIYAVALSGDGRLVVSCSYDGTVRVWDAGAGRPLTTLRGHTSLVLGVALSGDGRLVASGSVDGTVRLWATDSGSCVRTLHGHTGGVRGVALSRDGRLVASGSFDGAVRLWEAGSGQPLAALHGHTGGVLGVALCGAGRLVASGSFGGAVQLWDAGTGLPLATLRGHAAGVRSVAFGRNGRLVASGSFDGTVRIWDVEDGLLLATLRGHDGAVRSVALSDDGRLVASGGFDGAVRLWDVEARRPLATLTGHSSGVYSVALSRDGRVVASGSLDRTVRFWDVESGAPLATLRGHTSGAYSVALDQGGQRAASASLDGTIRIWEVGSGQSLTTLHGHTGEVYSVALSRDGQLVASGGLDGTVRLWDAGTGLPLATVRGHTGAVYSVALDESGRLAASGGADGTVRLWSVATGQLLTTLQGQPGGVWSVVLRDDGGMVASSGDDGTVRLWDVSSGALLRTLRAERRYESLDITGLTGVTEAQRGTLFALGAVERRPSKSPST